MMLQVENLDLSVKADSGAPCSLPVINGHTQAPQTDTDHPTDQKQTTHPLHRHAHGHGRKYIPHGYGYFSEWTPHNACTDPKYTDCGPDWSSRLRWLPHPQNPSYPAPENWPDTWHSPRYFPWTYIGSSNEWLIHPYETSVRTGRKCMFEGGDVHKASRMTYNEKSHSQYFGCRRKRDVTFDAQYIIVQCDLPEPSIDSRNGIWEASPGDKTYPVPECSSGFHKLGSMRPLINFSQPVTCRADTFVPLEKLPSIVQRDHKALAKKIELADEIHCVKGLDHWKPAMPLVDMLPTDDKQIKRLFME